MPTNSILFLWNAARGIDYYDKLTRLKGLLDALPNDQHTHTFLIRRGEQLVDIAYPIPDKEDDFISACRKDLQQHVDKTKERLGVKPPENV